MITFVADKNGKLTKIALKNCADISYSALNKLIRNKDVKVNGARVKEDVTLSVGDRVEIYYAPPKIDKFSLLYEDENITVVDKKAGYLSEDVFRELNSRGETYFIHRLDRNTAGVMVFARNPVAERELINGFKTHAFIKCYTAEVVGRPPKIEDTAIAYLKKDAKNSLVKIYPEKTEGAVQIKTGYKVISEKAETTVLEVRLYSGKTHQIRAHTAFLGCPIVGDGKYGDNEFNRSHGVKDMRLKSSSITLQFPKTAFLSYLDGKTFKVKGEF